MIYIVVDSSAPSFWSWVVGYKDYGDIRVCFREPQGRFLDTRTACGQRLKKRESLSWLQKHNASSNSVIGIKFDEFDLDTQELIRDLVSKYKFIFLIGEETAQIRRFIETIFQETGATLEIASKNKAFDFIVPTNVEIKEKPLDLPFNLPPLFAAENGLTDYELI